MQSSVYGEHLSDLYPVVEEGMSDSGCVDNVLEFLCMAGGRELPEVSKRVNNTLKYVLLISVVSQFLYFSFFYSLHFLCSLIFNACLCLFLVNMFCLTNVIGADQQQM